jgi:hypothetical protein
MCSLRSLWFLCLMRGAPCHTPPRPPPRLLFLKDRLPGIARNEESLVNGNRRILWVESGDPRDKGRIGVVVEMRLQMGSDQVRAEPSGLLGRLFDCLVFVVKIILIVLLILVLIIVIIFSFVQVSHSRRFRVDDDGDSRGSHRFVSKMVGLGLDFTNTFMGSCFIPAIFQQLKTGRYDLF